MDDNLFDLPDGWEWTTIGAISNYVQRGKSPKYTEASDLPVINQKCIRWNGIEIQHLKFIHPDQWSQWNEERFIKEGDILWNSTGTGTIGRAAIYKHLPEFQRIVADSHVTIVRAAHCSSDFLHYWIMSSFIQSRIDDMQSGSTNQVELSRVEVLKTLVPLPPINEQKRIVEKIESLRERSRAARKSIESIPTLIKQFRQSVLAAAFKGDLTKEWRENNSDVESAEVLLERIKNRRLNQLPTISKQQKLDDIYSYEEESLDLLPDGWTYATLDKISESFKYGTSVKSMNSGEIPVLRMGNLQQGKIDWDDLVYTSDREEIEKYLLEPNTVLFNRTNSPELVGKSSIYRGERTAIFAGYLIAIEKADELNSEYLNFCLNTSRARAYCWKVKSDGVSQSNINAQKLAKFELPLCSIEEQEEIVNRIESLFSHIDRIEAQYKEIVQEIDRLDRSILHQAFTGRLVAQDSDDEPAKILLEKIQIDRDRTKNKVKS
jgi:type I restriction enzyme, S subunit